MEALVEFKAIIFLLSAVFVAVVIQKLLGESDVVLSGPFKGVNVKVMGPLAGLGVVVILLMYAEGKNQEYKSKQMEQNFKRKEQEIREKALKDWTIEAKIVLLNQDDSEIKGVERDKSLENLRVNLAPDLPEPQRNQNLNNVVYVLPSNIIDDPRSSFLFTIKGDSLFGHAYAAIQCETTVIDSVNKVIRLGEVNIKRNR